MRKTRPNELPVPISKKLKESAPRGRRRSTARVETFMVEVIRIYREVRWDDVCLQSKNGLEVRAS
jgi:hypothetical protein